jgi:hypothetical protein
MRRWQVAEWFGEAPANSKSCAETADKNHCATYHADDEAYFDRVEYWTTPQADCGDDRGEVCKDYSEWAAPAGRSPAPPPPRPARGTALSGSVLKHYPLRPRTAPGPPGTRD